MEIFRKFGVWLGLLLAIAGLALWWWLQPERQVRRAEKRLVEALESRDFAAFERMLADEGTTIRKFFLHISKDEQRQRLQERIDDPKKRWKWSSRDLDERARWDDYQQAYEDALAATSTEQAPWYVVPADRNWYRDLAVSEVLVGTLAAMDLKLPDGEPGIEGLQVT